MEFFFLEQLSRISFMLFGIHVCVCTGKKHLEQDLQQSYHLSGWGEGVGMLKDQLLIAVDLALS